MRFLGLLLLLVVSNAWALVPPYYGKSKAEYRFASEAEVGLSYYNGNTNTESYNTRLKVAMDTDQTHQEVVFMSNYAQDSNSTSAEEYQLQLQSDLKMWADHYLFLRGSQIFDRFGSYSSETSLSSGYGTNLISRRFTSLKFEIGPGYRLQAPPDDSDKSQINEAIIRTALKFERRIHERTRFNIGLDLEAGIQNTTGVLDASLTNQLWDDLALKLGFYYRYSEVVDADKSNFDTHSTLNLLYTF
ncbi:DUF481 domain-containing protein [Gallaecimonas pentaromativorans]|uniref:Putative salt-induced outer membrane protein n=1 Tax=Gallaecimonas pentaromativorans TaxID=584787 RepID=A0A3N1P4J9_9GAMM|nr:DUF481 domain-containing protein [Gallaecimonas pentaromativorans]MED5523977.1 DUF481 domain-containing protein [Pseudomonadota bacterium]ROQ22401.1 putative salt-induced outer membrane protein [Gallaecimonas pentaromativorans]